MQFSAALLLATVAMIPSTLAATCLGATGLFLSSPISGPCTSYKAYINVVSGQDSPCSGTGSSSLTGPWTGKCDAGHSVVVVDTAGVFTATYTNATGSYNMLLDMSKPLINCSSPHFTSMPKCA